MPVLYRMVTRPFVYAVPLRERLRPHPSVGCCALCVGDLTQSWLPNVRCCCPTKAHSLRLAVLLRRAERSMALRLVAFSAMLIVIRQCRLHVKRTLRRTGSVGQPQFPPPSCAWLPVKRLANAYPRDVTCQGGSSSVAGKVWSRSPGCCTYAKAAADADGGRIKLPS